MGVDGRIPKMTLRIEGQTLLLTGHIHNNEVGRSGIPGVGEIRSRGASTEDEHSRDTYIRQNRVRPTFILHEMFEGTWRDRCY